MNCPTCGTKLKTIDSRPTGPGNWRRRKMCGVCNGRWTTREYFEHGTANARVTISAEALKRMRAAAVMLDNIQFTLASGVPDQETRHVLYSVHHGVASKPTEPTTKGAK